MINDTDYICRGCYRHIPSTFIESIIDFSRLLKEDKDRKVAIQMNRTADILVTIQRCPECTLKLLAYWKRMKAKHNNNNKSKRKRKMIMQGKKEGKKNAAS